MVYRTPYTQLPRRVTKSAGSIDRAARSDTQENSTPVRFQTTLTLAFKFLSNSFPRRGNDTGGSILKAILQGRYGITMAHAICLTPLCPAILEEVAVFLLIPVNVELHTVLHVSHNAIPGHRGRNHDRATVPILKLGQRHRL